MIARPINIRLTYSSKQACSPRRQVELKRDSDTSMENDRKQIDRLSVYYSVNKFFFLNKTSVV